MQKIKLLNEIIEYTQETNSKKNILFLHGFRSSFFSFASLKNLKRNYNIIAFNFPGHGNSTFNQDINLQWYIKITKEFIIKKKLQNLFVVGHSLGGAVAIALSKMQQVKQIILLAPFNPFIKEFHNLNFLKQMAPATLQEAKKNLTLMVQNKNKKVYFQKLESSAKNFLQKIKTTQKRFNYILFHEINSSKFHNNTLLEIYKQAQKNKITIFSGDRDYFVPKESSEKIVRLFKYQFNLIPNVGHAIIYEDSENMNNYFNKLI